jgi:LAO/AO transport system kinase
VEIAALADSTLVIVAPGLGDAIQAAKAGILEIGDVFVVNKSDKPGAQETVRDLRGMIAMAQRGPEDWKPPIVRTVALDGEGIAELAAKLDAHQAWLDSSGEGERRRLARARGEITTLALAELRQRMGGLPGDAAVDELARRVAAGELDPYSAADELIAAAS